MASRIGTVVLTSLLISYPFLVFFGLKHYGTARYVGLLLFVIFIARMVISKYLLPLKRLQALTPVTIVGISTCVLVILFDHPIFITLLPVGTSLALLFLFARTLYRPPSMIQQFAQITNPNLPEFAISYTRTVTKVWCYFFLINAGISAYCAAYSTLQVWTLYNGLISYFIIALIFIIEYGIRQIVIRKNTT